MSESVSLFKVFRPFSDEELQTLEIAHGEIRVVRGATPPARRWIPDDKPEPPWEAVFRKPTTGEGDNFEGSAHNDKAKAGALRNLAKAVIVGVSFGSDVLTLSDPKDEKSKRAVRDAWDRLRGKFPGAHMAAQDDLTELVGMAKGEAGKD